LVVSEFATITLVVFGILGTAFVNLWHWFKFSVEHRRHKRQTVIGTAWLRVKDDPVPMVCVVWDLSEGGARLAMASRQELPEEIALTLDRSDTIGTRCRVVWRSQDQIGVEFLENAQPLLHLLKQDAPSHA
jgi:hypothetical protein